ncbi:MAG: aminotransferase class V-fold PLP-dependent enzyme [Candidatus Lernaella stagnicola]|nr:aminotransferase class V-fold PLP-dependent enzyme [Candidatus Lernaella stagnicola]
MRKLPPVGTRLHWQELWAALRETPDAEAIFAEALRERIPCEEVFFFGSGRAALAAILSALRSIREGDRVIVPAYTCWSVPAAIVRAGMRVLPVDIKPGEIDYDFERLGQLDWRGVTAVVSPNLFGLPGDLDRLAALCQAHGATLIDDAAQSLGASVGGRPVGSFGAAGIVSFGRGKNITALGGGAALVRDEQLRAALAESADAFRDGPAPSAWEVVAKGGAMSVALSPNLFALAEQLPGVEVGRTVFDPEFATPALGAARAALGAAVLERLPELNKQRANLVRWIDQILRSKKGVILPMPRTGAAPAWLRRPILTQEIGKRDALLAALIQAGIGATAMYPDPVAAIKELEPDLDLRGAPFPGAKRFARSVIVLPLVESLTKEDLKALSHAVTDVMGKKVGERWA